MIVSMPPLRIFWPSANAYELDHGSMGMPRNGTTELRSAAYPLSSAPNGIAEVHIEHWTASATNCTDVGKCEIGSNDGNTNKDRAGFISWLNANSSLAVQYAHRRVFRFDNTDGTDSQGNSVVPDPTVGGDEIIEVKADGTVLATALRRAVTGGSRVLWKLADDLEAGPVFDFQIATTSTTLTAAAFIDNKSGDPGHLSSVKWAFYEDVSDFPSGPGTGGSNVPQD